MSGLSLSTQSEIPDFLGFGFTGRISSYHAGKLVGETRAVGVVGIDPTSVWNGQEITAVYPIGGTWVGSPWRLDRAKFYSARKGEAQKPRTIHLKGFRLSFDGLGLARLQVHGSSRELKFDRLDQVSIVGQKVIVIAGSALFVVGAEGVVVQKKSLTSQVWFVGKEGSIWSYEQGPASKGKFSEYTTVRKWSNSLKVLRSLRVEGQICPSWASDRFLVGIKVVHGHMGEPLVLIDLKNHREEVLEDGAYSAMSLELPVFKVNEYGS